MNPKFRKLILGTSMLGVATIAVPALADDTVTTTVDPNTGATVTVHEHDAILPRNDETHVTVTPPPAPVAPAPDTVIVDDDDGRIVEHHESTTVREY